ncbi:alpha-tocopherol transfer protein-like [Pararge aegeria]|uniref:alpha-tocopherol transfer protein-like n=1 Tax=Pararge aegeria TaxID=116150 RepID=UPI0019D02ABF|nr:alpha-tocopherol transfer protein-like [Pararge aegeria]XP_039758608.1 alpha-tocopherol transfer protein-like [Pararge aegeria]
MPQDTTNMDVAFIKEWMAKEPHLPTDLGDELIAKFLHSCYHSLEQTKKCIDRFCSSRSQMSEVYTNRDPLSPHMQTAFSITAVASYRWGDIEILIQKFDDPNQEKYVFYDFLRTHTLQGDYWIQRPFFAEGHYIILDMSDYTLKMISKTNIMFLRDYIVYMLEGMPIRVKKIIAINTPYFYDKFYALIKPALPAEICDIIHFYPDHESLYNIIDRKCLPKEYGGEGQSMVEQNKEWNEEILARRKMLLNENLWKADLKKKPKGNDNTMSGSFRTLSID